MRIEISCPSCGARLFLPDSVRDEPVACARCQKVFAVFLPEIQNKLPAGPCILAGSSAVQSVSIQETSLISEASSCQIQPPPSPSPSKSSFQDIALLILSGVITVLGVLGFAFWEGLENALMPVLSIVDVAQWIRDRQTREAVEMVGRLSTVGTILALPLFVYKLRQLLVQKQWSERSLYGVYALAALTLAAVFWRGFMDGAELGGRLLGP